MSVKVICLMGPTASGKTDLAIELVKQHPYEIVSVDSAMIYRGMDIGTAKPSKAELDKAPHRLIDICEPDDAYSAGQFYSDVKCEIEDIVKNGNTPLLVGGTMMYFHIIQNGIANLPEADPEIRERLQCEGDEIGLDKLHARLQEIDPESAKHIHPNDPQRLLRALEVYEITGKPLTQIKTESHQPPLPYEFESYAVGPDSRAQLHKRIEKRLEIMFKNGFIEEVKGLYEKPNIHKDLPSMRAVGYRQVWEHLDGKYNEAEMKQRALFATRQFAKRQLTWLRSWPDLKTNEAKLEL